MFCLLKVALIFALEATAFIASRSAHANGFERRELAPRDATIKLHVAVRQADRGAAVERQLLHASEPASPGFRQHLTSQEIQELSAPHSGSIRVVQEWLSTHNLLGTSTVSAGIFNVYTTIENAEKLLNTSYFVYTDGIRNLTRTDVYHVPDDIAEHVDFVTPTTAFPRARARKKSHMYHTLERYSLTPALATRASCGAADDSTPDCIRQAYGINYTAVPDKTTFAVYATEGASFNNSDLQTWLRTYNPPAAAASATFDISGSGDPQEKGGIEPRFEVSLDTQTLLGLAWPAKGIFYNRGGVFGTDLGETYDGFVQFLMELMTNETIPSVVSFSESMPEDQMDPKYAIRLCNMMAQIGTRGATLLFSSGDNGPNGDIPTGEHKAQFEPEFPASCPWVTSVGGTTNLADEQAATQFTISALNKVSFTASGGGFSNLFAAPSWQSKYTTTYIDKYVPASYHSESGFNASGRGIPDVSAFSTSFPTQVGAINVPIGGTSASTPVWAAIITLLNDYEASKNRSSLGFINPWLYTLKTGLKDITKGGNNAGACLSTSGCALGKTLGYNTTIGWDPVSGLGSPVFPELTRALDLRALPGDVIDVVNALIPGAADILGGL